MAAKSCVRTGWAKAVTTHRTVQRGTLRCTLRSAASRPAGAQQGLRRGGEMPSACGRTRIIPDASKCRCRSAWQASAGAAYHASQRRMHSGVSSRDSRMRGKAARQQGRGRAAAACCCRPAHGSWGHRLQGCSCCAASRSCSAISACRIHSCLHCCCASGRSHCGQGREGQGRHAWCSWSPAHL